MYNQIPLKKACDYASDKIDVKEVTLENYITTDNLLQNKHGVTLADKLPSQGTSLVKYSKENILVANIRPYLKKIWFSNNVGGCSADVLVFRVKEDFDSRFVYYSIFRDDFFVHTMKGSKGTKMPRGDKTQIMDFLIPNLKYPTQQKIATVLSSLDAKIKHNNHICAELEQMAKTLYNYWFVQFDFPNEHGKPYKSSGGKMVYYTQLKREIPEGWEVKTLSHWINADKGGDWGKESEEGNYTEKVNCIRGTDINGLIGKGELKAPIRYILEKNLSKILQPNDLIIEISGGSPTQSTGRLAYITEGTFERFDNPIICSNFCKAINLKDEKQLYYFAYYWNLIYDNNILFGWEGKTSGIKNLLFDSFVNHYKIPVPDESLIDKFNDFVKPIEAQKQKKLKENQELASLRDWLLPILMNGQVTVKEAEEKLNMAAEPNVEYAKK